MPGDIEKILAALTDASVEYLVVGGVAVVLHGHLRVTADLDIVLKLDPPNVERAMQVLQELGFRPRAPVPLSDFSNAAIRESWVIDKGLTVLSLWSPDRPGFELDLFVREPFDFESTSSRAVRVQLDNSTTMVVSIPDLIALKKEAGRPRDLEDISALRNLSHSDGKDS